MESKQHANKGKNEPTYRHLEVILYPEDWNPNSIKAVIEKRTSVDQYVIVFHDQDTTKDGRPVVPHYWCNKSGSYHSLIPGAAEAWGLPVEGCTASEPQRIVDALSSGKLVVAIMTKGHFTSSGHFIVLRGVQDGKILVADPNSYDRSQRSWDLSIILDEASDHAGAGGPF